jgi:hypothetical protein
VKKNLTDAMADLTAIPLSAIPRRGALPLAAE